MTGTHPKTTGNDYERMMKEAEERMMGQLDNELTKSME